MVIGVDYTMNATSSTPCDNGFCDSAVVDNPSHSIQCSDSGNYGYPDLSADDCLFNHKACLFHITEDPCEWTDIAAEHTDIVEMLMEKLSAYNKTQMYPLYRTYPSDPDPLNANPNNFMGFWAPWRDLLEKKSHSKSSNVQWWHIFVKVVLIAMAALILAATCLFCMFRYGRRRTESGAEYMRLGDPGSVGTSTLVSYGK